MRRVTAYIVMVLAMALGSRVAPAQQMNALAGLENASWEGIHLYGVNAFTSYVSSVYPINTTLTVAPGATQLGHDVNYGVSASGGWQYHRGDKLGVTVSYTGSYNRSQNYKSLSSFGHALRASAFWELTPKLTLDLSANGIYQTLAEYIFQPSSLSVTAQSPATINNVAASMGVGQFSNAQAASALTGGTAANVLPQTSLATSLLLGDRILSYATQASLSYQATERLSFNFSGVNAAGQNRTAGTSGISPQTYPVPHTLGLTAGGSVGYEISSRTSIGFNISGGRNSNVYQSGYTTVAAGTFGRMMGTRWFLHASGGAAYSAIIQQQQGAPKNLQVTTSGSLGYGLAAQTFLGSYNRSSMDANGFAIGTNTNLGGAWSWHRPDRRWNMGVSFGQQQLRNTGFASLSGWNASVMWYTHLTNGVRLTTQYAYSNSTGDYLGITTKITVNSVRLTVSWIPSALQAAAAATATAMRQP